MKRILVFLKLILLAFLLLVIFTYFFGNTFLNTSFAKSYISSIVKENLNYDLKLNGKLNLDFYPNIEVKLNKVKLNLDNKKIDIGKLKLVVPYKSVFGEKIIVNSIILNDSTLNEEISNAVNKSSQKKEVVLPIIKNIEIKNFKYFRDKNEFIFVKDLKASPIKNIGLSNLSSNFRFKDRNITTKFKTKTLKEIANGRKGSIELKIIEDEKEVDIFGDIEINKNSHSFTFNGKAFKGQFDGKLEISDTFSLKLNTKNFSTKAIEEEFNSPRILKGFFDIDLDIRNNNFLKNPKALNGHFRIKSDNVHIDNSILKTTAKGLHKILKPILGENKESECAIFNFDIKNGKFTSKEHVLQAGSVFIFPNGEIDILNNELKYSFHVNSDNPSLASLVPPFKASGPLNDISFYPTISGSIASVADTAEGIVGSAGSILKEVKDVVTFSDTKQLSGVALCQEKYEIDQKMISSRIGNLIK